MKYLILIIVAIISGCITTTDVYTSIRTVNDDTFKAATKKFCGELAHLAANRQLSDAEIVARYEFCGLYRARKD
jgi:hypothetical protein